MAIPSNMTTFCAGLFAVRFSSEDYNELKREVNNVLIHALQGMRRSIVMACPIYDSDEWYVDGEEDMHTTHQAINYFKEHEGKEIVVTRTRTNMAPFGDRKKFTEVKKVRVDEVIITDTFHNYNTGKEVAVCVVVLSYDVYTGWEMVKDE